MIEQLRKAIASRGDEMAELTAALIAIDTENPPGRNYERCLRFLGERLEALGFKADIERIKGGDADREHPRYWLRSVLGDSGPTVYFHGHIDVVPAQSRDQFEPKVTDETIFGRGSTDMKGGLVSMIYALWALRETSVQLGGRIALQVVPDEETGGAFGSCALSEQGLLVDDEAVAMYTAEPTGGIVWHACRGAITCRITVRGRQSHVGLQYRGVNAFENMLPVAHALRELKAEVEQRVTDYAIEPEEARRSILMMGGEVQGGVNFNVVPESFSFTVDRRINPEEDYETEKRRLLEAIDADVDVFQETRPVGVSETGAFAVALAEAIAEVRGEPARFELCPGILDIRFYAERGVPAFAYGPGHLSVAHGPKEFLKRNDLEEVSVVYALTAARSLLP